MNYLGTIFTDTVYVQFVNRTGIQDLQTDPIRLVSTQITDELSISFDKEGNNTTVIL